MIKAVIFDLDGTLLPMNEEEFEKGYFGLLAEFLAPLGFDKKQLVATILQGTAKMMENDGKNTNEEVFWQYFISVFGKDIRDVLDQFYLNQFKQTKRFCGENNEAKKIISYLKQHNIKTILASNPLFPRSGMITRMGFVGLKESDFDYITSYENCRFCKPNPNFFQDILTKNNLSPSQVVVFGNSQTKDIAPAQALNITAHLCLHPLTLSTFQHLLQST